MPIRVGILGAGFMGSTHAKAFTTVPDIEIAGIYGLSPNRAEPLAAEVGSTATTNLRQLIDDPSIDAIDVCLPGPQHKEATEAALAAGKHVLLEKPITLDLAEADVLVELGERSDRVFMIAHVCRFWPEYEEIKRLVDSGDYGRPVSALAFRRQPFPAWSALFSQSEMTGGAVIDMMIHDYDALNWILGAPKSVAARGRLNSRSRGYDQVQVMIDYGDASALVDGGMMMPESYAFTAALHVLCEAGAFEYTFRAGGRSVEMAGGVNELRFFPNEGDPQTLTVAQHDPYREEIAYFVDCIKNNTPANRASPTDARTALKVALAARKAVESPGLSVVAV
jgi:predicted dehydrogenase